MAKSHDNFADLRLLCFPSHQELSNGIISNERGGLPLTTASGASVGSIGVSGAPSDETDEENAKAAVDMIDFILENYL